MSCVADRGEPERDVAVIQCRLMEVFRDKLEINVPSPETDLMVTGLMDSLIFVDLLLHIENEYKIPIAIEHLEVESFRSIDSIARFIGNMEQTASPSHSPG